MENMMPVSEICNREVVVVQRNDTALEAAKLMRQHHVGDVLVVEDHNGIRIPVGIVTDRDLIMEIMAPELDGSVILNINTELSFEDIEGFVGDQFEPGERDIAFLLWAGDETKRVFTPIPGSTDFYIDLR